MRLKCLQLLIVLTATAAVVEGDSFNSEEDGLKPSLSCILWGDAGCKKKCSLLCMAFRCISCNPQCNTVFCDCQEKLPIKFLGIIPGATDSVELPPDVTFKQLLLVKFMRTPVCRELDQVMPTVPDLELEVKKFLYTTDLSGRELKQEMKRRFPKLRHLFRRLRPRPLAQMDPNVSAEVFKEGINVDEDQPTPSQSYFSSWLKPKPKKFDVNSPENQQRIINLIKKLPYKHDVLETFEVLRDSPEKPLYQNICRYFLKEGMQSPDGTLIVKPIIDPNDIEKKVLDDDVIRQLQNKIDQSNEQKKGRKRKRPQHSGENSSEERDAKKPKLDQPTSQSPNNGWWSPSLWGTGGKPGNENTPPDDKNPTSKPSGDWWWSWGKGKNPPNGGNNNPPNIPPLSDITNTPNGPAMQPNGQAPNQGPNSGGSWKWPSWNWPAGSGPPGGNLLNPNQSPAQTGPPTALIPIGTPITTSNSGRSLDSGEVINPSTGEPIPKKTPKKRKRKKLRKIDKTKDLPEDVFPDMEPIDKTLGKPEKKHCHKHKKRKHPPGESDSDESSSEEDSPPGTVPSKHKKKKKHHKKPTDGDESSSEEITPPGSKPKHKKKKKHHKKPSDSDESSSEEITQPGATPKHKKKKKHHKKPSDSDESSSEEITQPGSKPKHKKKHHKKSSDSDQSSSEEITPPGSPSKHKKKKKHHKKPTDNESLVQQASPDGCPKHKKKRKHSDSDEDDSDEPTAGKIPPTDAQSKLKKKKKKPSKSKPSSTSDKSSDESSSEEISPNGTITKHNKKKKKKDKPSQISNQPKVSSSNDKDSDESSSEGISPDGTVTKHTKKPKKNKQSLPSNSSESDGEESAIDNEPSSLSPPKPNKKPKKNTNVSVSSNVSINTPESSDESKKPSKKKPKKSKDGTTGITSDYSTSPGSPIVLGSKLPNALAGFPTTQNMLASNGSDFGNMGIPNPKDLGSNVSIPGSKPGIDALGNPIPGSQPSLDALGHPIPGEKPRVDALGNLIPGGKPTVGAFGNPIPGIPGNKPSVDVFGNPILGEKLGVDEFGNPILGNQPSIDAFDNQIPKIPRSKPSVDKFGNTITGGKPGVDAFRNPIPGSQPSFDTFGNPIPGSKPSFDAMGNPIPTGKPKVDEFGNLIPGDKPSFDVFGNPIPESKPSLDVLGNPIPGGKPKVDEFGNLIPGDKPSFDASGNPITENQPSLDVLGNSISGSQPSFDALGNPLPRGKPSVDEFGNPIPGSKPSTDVFGNPIPGDQPSLNVLSTPIPGSRPSVDALGNPIPGIPGGKQSVDEFGNPTPGSKPSFDALGNPISGSKPNVDVFGNPIPESKPSVDALGNPLPRGKPSVDEFGNPIPGSKPSTDVFGNPIPGDQPSLNVLSTPIPGSRPSVDALGNPIPEIPGGKQSVDEFGNPTPGSKPSFDALGNPISGSKPNVDVFGNPIPESKPSFDVLGNLIPGDKPKVNEFGNLIPRDKPSIDASGNLIPGGQPSLDELGNPILGSQVGFDAFGNPIPRGKPSVDEFGNPIPGSKPTSDVFGNPIPGGQPSLNVLGIPIPESRPSVDALGNPIPGIPGGKQSADKFGNLIPGSKPSFDTLDNPIFESKPNVDVFGNPIPESKPKPGMNPTLPVSTLTQLLGKQNPFITPTESLDGSHENISPEIESSNEKPISKDSLAPMVGVFRGNSNFPISQSSQPDSIPDQSPIMHKGGRDLSDHSSEDIPHLSNSATSSIPGNGPLSPEILSNASDLLHNGEIPDLDDSKISPTLDDALKQGLNTPTGDTPSLQDLLKNKLKDSKPPGSTIDGSLTPQKSSSDPSVSDISSLPSSTLVKQLLGKDLPPGSMPSDDQLKELVNKLKSGNLPLSGVPNSLTNDPLNSKLDPIIPHDDYLDALVNKLKAEDPQITPTASSSNNGPISNSNAIETPTDDYLQGLINKLKSGSPPVAGQQNSTSNVSAIPNSNDVKDPTDKYLEGLVNKLKSEGEPSLNPTSDLMNKPNDVMPQAIEDKLKSGDDPLLPSQMPSVHDTDGPPSLHDLLQSPISNQRNSNNKPSDQSNIGSDPLLNRKLPLSSSSNPTHNPYGSFSPTHLSKPLNEVMNTGSNEQPSDKIESPYSPSKSNSIPLQKHPLTAPHRPLNNLLKNSNLLHPALKTPKIMNDLEPASAQKPNQIDSNLSPLTISPHDPQSSLPKDSTSIIDSSMLPKPLGADSSNPTNQLPTPSVSSPLTIPSSSDQNNKKPSPSNVSNTPTATRSIVNDSPMKLSDSIGLPSPLAELKEDSSSHPLILGDNSIPLSIGTASPSEEAPLHNDSGFSPSSSANKNNNPLSSPNMDSPNKNLLPSLSNPKIPLTDSSLITPQNNPALQSNSLLPQSISPNPNQLASDLLSPIPNIDQASPVSKSPGKTVSTDESTGPKKPSIDLKKLLTSEELPSDLLSEEHDLSPEASATPSSPSSIPPMSSPLFSKLSTQDLNSAPSSEKDFLKPLTPLQQMPLSSLSPILMPTDGNPFEALLSDSAKPSTNTTPSGVKPSTGDSTATPSPLKNIDNQPIKSPDGLKPSLSQSPSIIDSSPSANAGRSIDDGQEPSLPHSPETHDLPTSLLGTPISPSIPDQANDSSLPLTKSPLLPAPNSSEKPLESNILGNPTIVGPSNPNTGSMSSPLTSNPKFASLFNKLKNANQNPLKTDSNPLLQALNENTPSSSPLHDDLLPTSAKPMSPMDILKPTTPLKTPLSTNDMLSPNKSPDDIASTGMSPLEHLIDNQPPTSLGNAPTIPSTSTPNAINNGITPSLNNPSAIPLDNVAGLPPIPINTKSPILSNSNGNPIFPPLPLNNLDSQSNPQNGNGLPLNQPVIPTPSTIIPTPLNGKPDIGSLVSNPSPLTSIKPQSPLNGNTPASQIPLNSLNSNIIPPSASPSMMNLPLDNGSDNGIMNSGPSGSQVNKPMNVNDQFPLSPTNDILQSPQQPSASNDAPLGQPTVMKPKDGLVIPPNGIQQNLVPGVTPVNSPAIPQNAIPKNFTPDATPVNSPEISQNVIPQNLIPGATPVNNLLNSPTSPTSLSNDSPLKSNPLGNDSPLIQSMNGTPNVTPSTTPSKPQFNKSPDLSPNDSNLIHPDNPILPNLTNNLNQLPNGSAPLIDSPTRNLPPPGSPNDGIPNSLNSKPQSSISPPSIPNSITITPVHPNSLIQPSNPSNPILPSNNKSPSAVSNTLNPSGKPTSLSPLLPNPSSASQPSPPIPNPISFKPPFHSPSPVDELDDSIPWLDDDIDISDDSMEFLNNRPKLSLKSPPKSSPNPPGAQKPPKRSENGLPSIPPLPLQAPNSSSGSPLIPKDSDTINGTPTLPLFGAGSNKPPSSTIPNDHSANIQDSSAPLLTPSPLSSSPNTNPLPQLTNSPTSPMPNIGPKNAPNQVPSTGSSPLLDSSNPSSFKVNLPPGQASSPLPPPNLSSNPSSTSLPNPSTPLPTPHVPLNDPNTLFKSEELPNNVHSSDQPLNDSPSLTSTPPPEDQKPTNLQKLFTSEELPDEVLSEEHPDNHISPSQSSPPIILPKPLASPPVITPPLGAKKPSLDLHKLFTSEELPSDLASEEHSNLTPTPLFPTSLPLKPPQQQLPAPSPLFNKPFTNFNNFQAPLGPTNTPSPLPNFNKPSIFAGFDDLPATPPSFNSFKPLKLPSPPMANFDIPITLPKPTPQLPQSNQSSDDPTKPKNSGQNWRQRLAQKQAFQPLS